jgi:NAD(P)H-flavin reductase
LHPSWRCSVTATGGRVALLLYYSTHPESLEDIIYRAELDAMTRRDLDLRVVNTLIRKQPEGWMGRRGRIDKALLAEACFPPEQNPNIFVCGSTPFVEDGLNAFGGTRT